MLIRFLRRLGLARGAGLLSVALSSLVFPGEAQESASGLSADSELPQVLIIGDSISRGYTPHVVELLAGKAVVTRNRGNAGPTLRGLESIDEWLGDTDWDVIHFNWGLWDMYRWRYEAFDQSPKAYEANLQKLVDRLKETGAVLIWATTTPACPAPEMKAQTLVTPEMERAYLEAARRVMRQAKVLVNDLNLFMASRRSEYALADNDVHYTPQGYRALAEQVAKRIEAVGVKDEG